MVTYRIVVKDHSGNALGEFKTFRNLTFGKNLDNYAPCSFEIPSNDFAGATLIALRRYSVSVYRRQDDDPVGVLVWAGEQALKKGHLSSSKDNWVLIQCFDWFEQLYHRITSADVRYDGIDAGMIAWDMINTAQTDPSGFGDMGITEGDITETVVRDRKYFNQNIGEAIINLCNVSSGFDFEITNDKEFNVYPVKGTDLSESIIFEYGKNITDVDVTEDFINIVNRSIVLGEASDVDELRRVDRNNTDFQSMHGLRESVTSEMSVTELQTLNDKGDAVLRKYQLPLLILDISVLPSSTPSIVDFSLGDLVRVVIKNETYDINKEYRVFGWEVKQGNNNSETLKLILGDFTTYGS